MNMRLLGARTIKEVVPEMIDAGSIHQHIVSVPDDAMYYTNCESTYMTLLQEDGPNILARREPAICTFEECEVKDMRQRYPDI